MFSSNMLVFSDSRLQKIVSCHLQDAQLQIGQMVSKLRPMLFLEVSEIPQVTDSFLSPPVPMHGGLICIAFRPYVCH